MHCLANKTAQANATELPGARSRYDDFTGIHLQQTVFVHGDGLFLPFHRYYVWLYEKALRDECGYQGAQPYWDWTLSYQDPRNATVFDGSPWSMGSNGAYVPNRDPIVINIPGGPSVPIPPGTGGGCVYSGPFTPDKFQLHLGPVGFSPQGPNGGLGYNPRCVSRDLNPLFSNDTRPTKVAALLDGAVDIAAFSGGLDAPGGVHGSGHFQVGGIELDVYASPGDPIFWLHHAQIDRLWAIWQHQDIQTRQNEVWGTGTSGNGSWPPAQCSLMCGLTGANTAI